MNFDNIVNEALAMDGYKKPLAFAIAKTHRSQLDPNKILSLDYLNVNWQENEKTAAIFLHYLSKKMSLDYQSEIVYAIDDGFVDFCMQAFGELVNSKEHKNAYIINLLDELKQEGKLKDVVLTMIFDDVAPKSIPVVYLKLYALSLKKVKPRTINLDGAFGILENLAWSGNIPIDLEWLRQNEMELKLRGAFPQIDYVDKFPTMLMHVIPSQNTRILDSKKVRLGAHIADGTTIMPGASYVNFNAGTLGISMVEGRISSSAVVGEGSDVGGGASILGVLSGTDGNPISVGKNCLLGANSVTGIALGDACIIDAGIAVLEGTKVFISNENQKKLNDFNDGFFDLSREIYKAKDLCLLNKMHFRQDSQSGQISCTLSKREIKLNADLH